MKTVTQFTPQLTSPRVARTLRVAINLALKGQRSRSNNDVFLLLSRRFEMSALMARVDHRFVSESASTQIHRRSPRSCPWFSGKSLGGARSCPQRHHSVSTASSVIRLLSQQPRRRWTQR